MEWSNEKVLQLIAEYNARPMLWDPKDWEYKNRMQKNKAWEEMAHIFNISRLEIERKFKILLVQYRREKSKILRMVEAGYDLAELEATAWYAYKGFAFLSKRCRPKKIAGPFIDNTAYYNETEYEEIKIEPTSDECEAPSSENKIEDYLESTIEEIPESKKRNLSKATSTSFPMRITYSQEATDDIDLFASYVASEMRNLSNPNLRKKLKRKILKAMLEVCDEDDAIQVE